MRKRIDFDMQLEATDKLEELLKAGKQEEAKNYLRELLQEPLSDEERGALLVGFAAAYLALQHSVNTMHRDILAEDVGALEKIGTLQHAIDEKLRLANVRSSLHGTDTE